MSTNAARSLRESLALVMGVMTITLFGLGIPAPAQAAGGGGGGGGGGIGGGGSSGKQGAVAAYKRGENRRDRGIKLLQEAAAASRPEDKQKALDNANKQFKRALREYKKATRANRKFHQAYNGIGFAQRMLGNFDDAIEAYDKALELEPGFPHAIEYRGEAYMKLGRLDDAKAAYMELFADHRKLADMLMKKMHAWVTLQRERERTTVPAEKLDSFAKWVAERREIAEQTAALTGGAAPHNW